MPPKKIGVSVTDIGKVVQKIRGYIDARNDPGWTERRQSWMKGWKLMKDLLVCCHDA
jgi:anti-anti-sigma regulatory factor